MIYGGNIARATKRKAAMVAAPNHRLEVTWFNGWHPALDEALQSLPENDACPHELFRLLVQTSSSAPKRGSPDRQARGAHRRGRSAANRAAFLGTGNHLENPRRGVPNSPGLLHPRT
jgi:hypothetical protein